MVRFSCLVRLGALAASLLIVAASPAAAGAPAVMQEGEAQDTTKVYRLTPVTVTATRTAKNVFYVPMPVIVLDRTVIREQTPNTVSDLLRGLPGLDVTGVGTNQVRPSIRGHRGQRILLLQDGIRLNNSRRQQDFGELPALVDVSTVDRVEVVRGPASVLYGSDAIGGVINLITRTPDAAGIHGWASYRHGTYDNQNKAAAQLSGRMGRLSFLASGTFRDSDEYDAPAGSFGDITLGGETPVFDTGVRDHSVDAYVSFDVTPEQRVFAKFQRYRADSAGFGWVDPQVYAPGEPTIQITYPFQRFDKLTAGYNASTLGMVFADRISVLGYVQDNDRRFDLDIFVPLGPGAGVQVDAQNFTDISTVGFRLEATKLAASRLLLTYGADFFRDGSENTDSSTTTVTGFGPPSTVVSNTPLVPNASFRSLGVFAQGDVQLTDRLSIILGIRYQDVHAATQSTPGVTEPLVTKTDRTFVGAANAIYGLTDNLSLIGSVGRAFRSPNLVERFFNGPTPEGQGFQVGNPNLKPETSLNLDVGVRYRNRRVYAEAFVFRNHIRDGIRIAATGDTIAGLTAFQNINVDNLRFTGIEVSGDVRLPAGFSVGAHYTHLDSKDVNDPANPLGDTFSSKLGASLRYTHSGDLFWAEYRVRHNGQRRDVDLGTNPVGATLPAFTVHSARGGVTLLRRGSHTQRLGIAVTNISNALYAEFPNVAFFRPEPRRGVTLTWEMSF